MASRTEAELIFEDSVGLGTLVDVGIRGESRIGVVVDFRPRGKNRLPWFSVHVGDNPDGTRQLINSNFVNEPPILELLANEAE